MPLVALVYFKADIGISTELIIDDGRKKRVVEYDSERLPEAGLPIIGLRANTDYRITITITS